MERNVGDGSGYMCDPVDIAERTIRIMAQHDNVKDPSNITLRNSFEELGLNELDMVEVYLMLEAEFDMEISEDHCESFTIVNDIVENIARDFYASWNEDLFKILKRIKRKTNNFLCVRFNSNQFNALLLNYLLIFTVFIQAM